MKKFTSKLLLAAATIFVIGTAVTPKKAEATKKRQRSFGGWECHYAAGSCLDTIDIVL